MPRVSNAALLALSLFAAVRAHAGPEESTDAIARGLVDEMFDRAARMHPLQHEEQLQEVERTTLAKSAGTHNIASQPGAALSLNALAGTPLRSTWRAQSGVSALRSPASLRAPVARQRSTQVKASLLEGAKPAAQAYADIWVPLFKSAQEAGLPDVIIKWGHPAAMGTVLCTMGVFGSYLGWAIRNGEGSTVGALTLGQTYSELHPKLMGAAVFFFFLGGQGGLVLNQVQGKPILDSTHATTAVLGLFLLAVQALLPLTFGSNANTRTAHAFLGSATMAVLFFHMMQGIALGNSA